MEGGLYEETGWSIPYTLGEIIMVRYVQRKRLHRCLIHSDRKYAPRSGEVSREGAILGTLNHNLFVNVNEVVFQRGYVQKGGMLGY